MLEELFLDNVGNRKPQLAFLDVDVEEVEEVNNNRLEGSSASDTRQQNGTGESPSVDERSPLGVSPRQDGARKRRRVGDPEQCLETVDGPWMPPLPALPLLEAVVEAHFRTVHHWMPILHETRFRANLKDDRERARLAVLFHALVSTSLKHVKLADFGMALENAERQIRVSRRAVVLNAMESLSVENTQALAFLAFDYVR